MPAATVRKKLIEVSIPLEAINAASAREKSIRHGHPSTLHLWWARRPLAACRAVLFAQLVDDPSSWPDRFDNAPERIDAERRRLHLLIGGTKERDYKDGLVAWESSNNEAILNAARWEIARSVAWGLGEEPPAQGDGKAILDYLQTKAPPVYDPFSGGGSIPLEAQRLGLRAYGSDLNPVAVLIGKALVEIPPKFAGRPPVNPKARAEAANGQLRTWKGAQGLAEDVRYYGQWMRDEAEKRIGHLYPQATLADGSQATVIAWLWARTVRSPDPAARGAMVPLVSNFMLASKPGKKAWVEPTLDPASQDGYRFRVRTGEPSKDEEDRIRQGTKVSRGNFSCLITGSAISETWNRAEAKAGRLGVRLMAVVAEGKRARSYVSPTDVQEQIASSALPEWKPTGALFDRALGFRVPAYGLTEWSDLFSPRQLVALTTLSDLIGEARSQALTDMNVGSPTKKIERQNGTSQSDEESQVSYADALSTYLAFALSRTADLNNSLCRWEPGPAKELVGHLFSRQTLSMVWDFAEASIFSGSSGDWLKCVSYVPRLLEATMPVAQGYVENADAAGEAAAPDVPSIIATDPPYYDNIGYADLSDFFYVWLRGSMREIWPDLFRRLLTPKLEELVATPGRNGAKAEAETFFMRGMSRALKRMRDFGSDDYPVTLFYAFRQSEQDVDGTTSAGWASFLQAIVDANCVIDGTWPVRTETTTGLKGLRNALASSIVLVCRKRPAGATIATRAEFVRALKREMPVSIDAIRKAGVGPVDMQQSVIGPGMGIFSRHAKVLEDDDSVMSVKTALALINRVWEEIENELDQAFDAETQVALAWFATYGFDARSSGELITLANAKNVPLSALFVSGVFSDGRGKAGLTARASLSADWEPGSDKGLTVWECVQHTARVLNAEDGGGQAAARLVAQMGPKAADARALAYRLYEIASAKSWAAEALVYNELAQEWPRLEDLAQGIATGRPDPRTSQGTFAFAGEA